MMSKTNVAVDKILKGITINKNNEVDYIASIVVEMDDDIPFQYAVVDDGMAENTYTPFIDARKYVVIKHKNTNGIFKKKLLLLKSIEKANAEVTIDIERVLQTNNLETLGPIGSVLLNNNQNNNHHNKESHGTIQNATTPGKEWYKDPMILMGILILVILLVVFMSKKSKNNDSLFV